MPICPIILIYSNEKGDRWDEPLLGHKGGGAPPPGATSCIQCSYPHHAGGVAQPHVSVKGSLGPWEFDKAPGDNTHTHPFTPLRAEKMKRKKKKMDSRSQQLRMHEEGQDRVIHEHTAHAHTHVCTAIMPSVTSGLGVRAAPPGL